MIREALSTDVPAITSIYNHYILNSTISFEEEVLQESHFKAVGYKFGQWIDVGYWQVSLRGANT